LTAEESAKTDGLERKATAVASLSGLVVAVNGAFGLSVVRTEGGWSLALYLLNFPFLLGAVGAAAWAVRPATHTVFGEKYVRGLETLAQLKLTSSQARL
jgi:hypothetical protein